MKVKGSVDDNELKVVLIFIDVKNAFISSFWSEIVNALKEDQQQPLV